jgi:hypothetical protein
MYHYGIDLVDVIEGRGPAPLFVLALIKRLPDTSLFAALASGGEEHFGWGQDRHMIADLFDALSLNTRATGRWKSKPPKIPEYPRPKSKAKKKPKTVKELFKQFTPGKH